MTIVPKDGQAQQEQSPTHTDAGHRPALPLCGNQPGRPSPYDQGWAQVHSTIIDYCTRYPEAMPLTKKQRVA